MKIQRGDILYHIRFDANMHPQRYTEFDLGSNTNFLIDFDSNGNGLKYVLQSVVDICWMLENKKLKLFHISFVNKVTTLLGIRVGL